MTHLHKTKEEAKAYLKEKFDDAWNYYDVNHDGHVDASWVATILRFMCRPDVDLGL